MTFPVFMKASRSKISVAKEIREVNRLRLQFERSMTERLISVFERVGREAAKEYLETGVVRNAVTPIERRVDAVFRAHYESVISTFADRVYSNRKLEAFGNIIREFYVNQGGQKIRNVSTTTQINILKAILQGDGEGLNPRETAKLIEQRTGGAIGRARASTIARTETHAAASYATHTATKELNLPMQKKRWVSVGDARTRAHHAAANGQEVGIDEKFVLRYQGQEILMMHPHDGSGGAANNINCRCLAIYFSDIDDLFDDVPAAEVQDVVVADDLPTTFRDTAIMADNLPRIGKKKAKAEIDKALSEAYKLPENQAVWGHLGTNWQDMDASKLGGSVLKSFSERAVEMISYVHTVEFAKLAKQAGIPNIRGIKLATRKGVNGAMGGGVLHLRTEAIEAYVNTAKIRDLDLISEEMRAAKIRRFEVQDDLDKFNEKTGGDMFFSTSKLSAEDLAEYERLNAAFKKADTEYRTLNSEYMAARDAQRRGAGGSVATYKVGGDILERPWSTKEYFPDGLDKVRALMFHEFGHHIHQSYRINDAYSRSSYVEKILQKFFKETARSELEYWAPSSYAMSNEYEYFVESLVMYIFDRKDMTHPKMIALIDEVLNVKN